MKVFEILDKLKDILSENPNIKGFVLVGSQARDDIYKATEYSDMEAYIIVDDKSIEQTEKFLETIVQKLGTVLFSYRNRWSGFSTVFEDLFRLELPLVKISELDSVFSRPKAQTVKIIIDKTEGKLEKALNNRLDNININVTFNETVLDFWYMLIVGLQYFKKDEIWNSRSVLQILQSLLIKLFELYNNPDVLLLETNKRVEELLTQEQIILLEKVSPSYDKENIKSALKEIAGVFSQIALQLSEKYHLKYDKKLEEELKSKIDNLI